MVGVRTAVSFWLVSISLLLALPGQQAPAATGTAEGRVLGPLGEPMLGVEVRAAIWPDLDTAVAKTRTDGEGMFVLGRLPLRTVSLFATATGLSTGWGTLRLSADAPDAADTLRLWPANTLRGRVVDADGAPLAGAVVLGTKDFTGFDGGFRSPEMQTGADGRFELAGVPIGDCVLRAWAPGFVMKEVRMTTVSDQEVELRLDRGDGAVLSVRTVGLPPDVLDKVRVSFYPTRNFSGFSMPRQLESGSLDGQGTFRLSGLPEAEWNVSLAADGFTFDPRSVRTKMGASLPELTFTATAVGSLQLRGVLRSKDGLPLAGERLLCRTRKSQSMNGGTPGEAVTDAEGRFQMAAPLVAGEPYSLHLVGSQWALLQQKTEGMTGWLDARYLVRYEDNADAARELSLVAVPAAFVTARLVDGNGKAVPFAWTELQERADNRSPAWMAMAYATSQRDGKLVFTGVHGLDRDLRLATEGGDGAGTSEMFHLAPGERRALQVTVQRPGKVTGRLLDQAGKSVAGCRLSLGNYDVGTGQQVGGSWSTVPTDRDGRFAFVGVSPGGHKAQNIREEARACSSDVFEVRPGATVHLELRLEK